MFIIAFQAKKRWYSWLLLPFALIFSCIGCLIFVPIILCTLPARAIGKLNLEFPNSIIPEIAFCYGFNLFAITIVVLPKTQYRIGPSHAPWLTIESKAATLFKLKAHKITEPWSLCRNVFKILQQRIQLKSAQINTEIQLINPIEVVIATLVLSFIESFIPESRVKTNFICCHNYQTPQMNIKLNLECECRCRLLPMLFSLRRQLNKHME